MLKTTRSMRLPRWLTLIVIILLVACGGSGDGGDSADGSPDAPVPSSGTTVNGSASKGPLDTSDIDIYDVDPMGDISGSSVATVTTDSDGLFTLAIPAGHTDHFHIIQATGGSYVDESDQSLTPRSISFDAGELVLETILPIATGTTTVALTPYTNALLTKSRNETNGTSIFEIVFNNNHNLATEAYGFDILTTLPADPTSPDSGASDDEKLYALLLGGAANAINNIAIALGHPEANADMIVAFIEDLSDGQLDGTQDGTLVKAFNNDSTPILENIPNDVDINDEIQRFRNNNQSAYGSLLADVDSGTLANSGADAFWDDFNWDEALWQ